MVVCVALTLGGRLSVSGGYLTAWGYASPCGCLTARGLSWHLPAVVVLPGGCLGISMWLSWNLPVVILLPRGCLGILWLSYCQKVVLASPCGCLTARRLFWHLGQWADGGRRNRQARRPSKAGKISEAREQLRERTENVREQAGNKNSWILKKNQGRKYVGPRNRKVKGEAVRRTDSPSRRKPTRLLIKTVPVILASVTLWAGW